MEHLSAEDITALNYHNELGDILEPEEFLRITQHLDSCDVCKKRYSWANGHVIDRKEVLEDEILQRMSDLIYKARPFCDNFREFCDYCMEHGAKEVFDNQYKEYKLYGGEMEDLIDQIQIAFNHV